MTNTPRMSAIHWLLLMLALSSTALRAADVSADPTQAAEAGSVANATFTTAIVGGQPTDFREEIDNSVSVVYYYAEIEGLQGQTAVHRWKHEGKVMAEVPITVKAARWPAWSSMKMQPEWTGEWSVEVLNGSGQIISTDTFAYTAPL